MGSDEASEYAFRNMNSVRIRTRNANGIRNLNVLNSKKALTNTFSQTRSNKKNSTGWLLLKLLLIAVCLTVFIVYENSYNLSQDLKNHYHTAYEKLSQLSNDLCSKHQANYTPILEAIDHDIVGQQHLHGELNNWLQMKRNSSFSCAVFVGGTGVGKSFTANIIVKYYPYPTNVFIISVKELSNEKKRYTVFKMALFKILRETITRGKCAHYMIVLDSLSSNDMPFLKKISDRLRAAGNAYQLMLQALFVFQGTAQNIQQETIKKIIPEAQLIKFKTLGINDLEFCIRREASTLGIDLGARDYIVQLVANQINVSRYGCKPVRAKMSLYSV